ncbi:MAG: class I SAM-dependent methyltransferase [Candidatus Omnitrophica bacterium]|nr:class I SAM-dependent methyltransferase [Candidatus Omnitrophota bacterium]
MKPQAKHCIICEKSNVDLLYPPLAIVKCQRCGLIYRDVLGIEEGYYFNLDKYRKTLEDPLKMASRQRDAILRFDILEKIIPFKGRLFDIGANDGITMQEAQKRGFQVFGCEPNIFTAGYAQKNGLDVINDSFEKAFLQIKAKGPFDVITAFHVLEHFSNPLEILEMIKQLLVSSGWLIIEIPDIDSPISRIYKWEGLRIHKEHLFYFNKKTLITLLKKAGFEIIFLKSKVWDGLNRPFIENLIRLPMISEIYMMLRQLKKYLKIILGIKPVRRTNLEDNVELWIKEGDAQEGSHFLHNSLGRLIYNLNRGDDLFIVAQSRRE